MWQCSVHAKACVKRQKDSEGGLRAAPPLPPPHPLQAASALRRASRGGLLNGSSLLAVASLLLGAAKLRRAIVAANREAERTGHAILQPLAAAFKASGGGRVMLQLTITT